MELTLEVIMVPVSDPDRSKTFYEEGCGFKVDLDQEVAPGVRIIQLTPPGSRCSIAMGSGLPGNPDQPAMPPARSRACNCARRTSPRPERRSSNGRWT